MAEEQNGSAAWPVADAGNSIFLTEFSKLLTRFFKALTQEILDIVQQASHYRQLKKGANEGLSTQYLSCPADSLAKHYLQRPKLSTEVSLSSLYSQPILLL